MKRSWAGEMRNLSLLVAIGVTTEGCREILGIMEGPKEDKSGWASFLRHLADRGLSGVQLIVSFIGLSPRHWRDGPSLPCRGLVESAAEVFPDALWQRCVVFVRKTIHWIVFFPSSLYRNVFSLMPSGKVRPSRQILLHKIACRSVDVTRMLKAIHAREDRQAAAEKMQAGVADLRALKLIRAAELLEESGHETLTYDGFPDSHWIKLRTNNPLEGIMRKIRRRTRVVGAFPDGKSCLNLAAARSRPIAGTQWSTRKYMNMTPLLADQSQGADVARKAKCERSLTQP